jgi:hypothetical protein
MLLLCCMGCNLKVETIVTNLVLMPFFSTEYASISYSDSNNSFITSTSFRQLLFPSGGSDKFALICSHFTFVTAIYNSIKKIEILICLIFYYCFHFGYIIEEPTPF